MSEDLIEFFKNEYIPKSTIRYMKEKLVNERKEIIITWTPDYTPNIERIKEIDNLIELIDTILKC